MNKRIEELEAQCWETRKHPVSQAAMGDQFNTEKFAKLIIRECADIASMNQHQYESTGVYVLKHFGVER